MSEEEIVQGCLQRTASAQKALYEAFSGRMMSLCLRYAKSREEAEDILQEGFIKIFEKIGQFSGTGSLAGWIRAVMVNTALIHIRRNKKWNYMEDVDEQYHLENQDHSILSEMAAEELMKLVMAMPQGYRTVFSLFAIEGYSHKEIAELLEITESTSKTQFHKAKAFLKKAIGTTNASIESER